MKRMKYISMMLASMALAASPLLAQEASAEAPLGATTLLSTTSAQAKPSPEFRSYVRLVALNILTDITTNADLAQYFIEESDEPGKYVVLFVDIAVKAVKAIDASPREGLKGEEKAFVDEMSTWLSTFSVAYKATDMEDEKAVEKLQMQAMISTGMLSQKYPKVLSYFDSMNNFFDVEKIQALGEKEMENAGSQTGAEANQSVLNMFTKVAEMIRKNEV